MVEARRAGNRRGARPFYSSGLDISPQPLVPDDEEAAEEEAEGQGEEEVVHQLHPLPQPLLKIWAMRGTTMTAERKRATTIWGRPF